MKAVKTFIFLIATAALIPGVSRADTLHLRYSTYLGGSSTGNDKGFSVTLDAEKRVYLTGDVASSDFPELHPCQNVYGGGISDIFISCLDSSGSALLYSTYLGGSGDDTGRGIVLDTTARVYLTGYTSSPDFPTENPYQAALGGGNDAVVVCLSSSGSSLVYSSYLGGAGDDYGEGISLDVTDRAFVAGYTSSADFPTENPYQAVYASGNYDAFITALESSGSTLLYSTYLGGSAGDYAWSVAISTSNQAYLAAETLSDNFPTVNPYQSSREDSWDIAVATLSSSGSALIYSTYFGGSDIDGIRGIVLDSCDQMFLAGYTLSSDFPTLNPYQPEYSGGDSDSVAFALSADGSSALYSTYLGGSGYDRAYGIALSSAGSAYLAGRTESPDFPTVNPYQSSLAGVDPDIFIAGLSSTGSALEFSSYLGGSGADYGRALAVDSAGVAYVTGYSWSRDFPTVNPYQPKNRGDANAVVSKLELAPLDPAIELTETVDGLPEGTAAIIQCCADPSYYYLVSNRGDYYISEIEVWDDNGTPDDSGDDVLIGTIPGPLAPTESAELSYPCERVAMRRNTATATGNPTDSCGHDLPDFFDVTAGGEAMVFTWLVQDGNDFRGDGIADMTTWKCGEGKWSFWFCPDDESEAIYFGRGSDLPAAGDYDGDGITDVTIFRPETGLWVIRGVSRVYFGADGDTPVPADYDGDGDTDIGIFRRPTGLWAIRGQTRTYFGGLRDLPIPGYYDGGPGARIGIYRPSWGLWALRGLTRHYYGIVGDYPVPADYSGDGIDQIGIFRVGSGLWAIDGGTRVYFGARDHFPQPADYDGSERADHHLSSLDRSLGGPRSDPEILGRGDSVPVAW